MRDAFLVFLMVLVAGIAGGYVWFAVWLLRASGGDEEAGCGALALLFGIGCFAVAAIVGLLSVVGHAVGIDMTSLTGH
jgi:hypothetical protein